MTRHAVDYTRLPPPRNGHYYLRAHSNVPAIFRIEYAHSPDRGKWMVCPEEADVPFSGGRILAFGTPEAALDWLRREAALGRH